MKLSAKKFIFEVDFEYEFSDGHSEEFVLRELSDKERKKLIKSEDEDIEKFIKRYLKASIKGNVDKLIEDIQNNGSLADFFTVIRSYLDEEKKKQLSSLMNGQDNKD